jgi:hypothetical protein
VAHIACTLVMSVEALAVDLALTIRPCHRQWPATPSSRKRPLCARSCCAVLCLMWGACRGTPCACEQLHFTMVAF